MGKIKDFIKKHDNIFLFLILLVMATTFAFNIQLGANDELWCFSNIYKMTNGFEIYKDLNVIITPLFFFIGKIIFEIFGANYLIYRIYAIVIIYLAMFFVIYKLYKVLKIEKINAMLYTILIASICLFILLDPSYNMLSITMALIGIIILIKNVNCSAKLNVLQGIIMFLAFLSKQNIGAFYIIGVVVCQILLNKDIKQTIKNIFIQLLTSFIALITFLVYLQINDNLFSFINYTVLGIGEFANKNLSCSIGNVAIIFVEMIIAILFIVFSKKEKIPFLEIERRNIRILATISVCMNFIAFPLINTAHTLIASVVFGIFLSYVFDLLMFKELLVGKKINKVKKSIIIIIFIMFLILNIVINTIYCIEITKDEYYFSKSSPYYGSVAKEETLKEIKEICTYIKEQNEIGIDVKIISYYSNLYMNIFNRNNGAMDLPFYGNMGEDGEDGMISQIQKLRNTKILILTEDDELYQESKKVTGFIKENYEKEGEICRFSIYKSN